MNYPEDLATAADYLKKSIPHMVKNQIPANPINYTLWYSYVANKIPALNKALDNLVKNNPKIDQNQSLELYRQYIIHEHLEDHQKTLEGITQLAAQILGRLHESSGSSDIFDDELSNDIKQLKQSTSMGEITEIIDHVVSTSESIRETNRNFKKDMQKATKEISSLRSELKKAEKQAFIDRLTQLYNRHAFDQQLEQLIQDDSTATNVYLILADLDHFKSFNDDYGHVIGDRVLQRMGALIQDFSPDNAFSARYGGEEFAILLSNSSIEEAKKVADQLRIKLQQLKVKVKNSDKVLNNITASFGIANFSLGESPETFIDRSDKALYRAKSNGRNRVEIYTKELDSAT